MFCSSLWRASILALAFSFNVACGYLTMADDAPADDQVQDKKADAEAKDRYAIPDGDTATLLKFVEGLQKFRPATAEQFFEHRKKAPAAMKAAAEKILTLEKDSGSPAAQKAKMLLLSAKVAALGTASPEDQSATIKEIAGVLKAAKALSRNELGIAFQAASALEQTGNTKLAVAAYKGFGQLFSQQASSEELVSYGTKMLGAARRLDLPGNEMKLDGTLFDGSEFDWKAYRGKVVLVDFWATWCGPCIEELPNVKKHYALYHEKGFDVVGISLDTDRGRLAEFLEKNKLPWTTLFQDGGGWDHPIASYYGIMGIPTVILVDKKGKVISLNARGPELGRLLEEQLGAPNAG